MQTGQPLFDAGTVVLDVIVGLLPERFAGGDDGVVVLTHLGRREVRVRTGTVPVTLDRLRREMGGDVEVLGDAVEQPARHPELID